MNSYSFDLAGSWWLLILAIIVGFGFAYYTYRRTVPPVSGAKRTILMTLRTLALALLLFALFEPVLTIISGKQEPPKVAVLLDKSESVAATDALGDRKKLYDEAIEKSGIKGLDEDERKFILFDGDISTVKKIENDSLKFNGQLTDISNAIKWTSRNLEEENIRAALMITDGAFNTGNNPVYEADIFGKPIYTIGIGDSTEPKDVAVTTILTNEIAYVDNPVPVNVNVKVNGYDEGTLSLVMKDNGKKFDEQEIKIHPDRNEYTAIFEYTPKVKGYRKITAEISGFEDEITHKNNNKSEFINVLDNKRNIAVFAGAPSPDLSMLKQTISQEKGVKITDFIQKKGSEYYGDPPSESKLSESDIIILCGFPINSTPVSTLELIKSQLKRGKSLFFIASYDTDYNKLKRLEEYLPFRVAQTGKQEFTAITDFKREALSNPLLRIKGVEEDLQHWNKLPPIYRTETFVDVKPESEVAAGMKVNNVEINEPLIMTRSFNNKKSVAVVGYGLYRWKLLGYAAEASKGRSDTYDLYDIFMDNAIRWLAVREENEMIRIKTTKKHFTNTEEVEFTAQVYDAAYTPIDNAEVVVTVSGGEQPRDLILHSIGNGRYNGDMEGLGAGDYAFKGIVTVNDKKIGDDNGRFSVGKIDLEYQNLKMNVSLLRQISERTGGKFYTAANADQVLKDIRDDKTFKSVGITSRDEFALWNLPWILAAAILLFGIEWFLRKRAGMI